MNNFITRTLSAIVYAAVVIASLLIQPACFGSHMLLFGVVFMIVSTLAIREFHNLVGASDVKIQSYAMIASALLFCTLYFLFYGDMVWRPLLFAYVAVLLLTMIIHLFRKNIHPAIMFVVWFSKEGTRIVTIGIGITKTDNVLFHICTSRNRMGDHLISGRLAAAAD